MVATIDLNSSAVQEIEELYGKSRRVNYIFDSIIAALRFVMLAA